MLTTIFLIIVIINTFKPVGEHVPSLSASLDESPIIQARQQRTEYVTLAALSGGAFHQEGGVLQLYPEQ